MSCPEFLDRTALTLKNETSSPSHGGVSSDPDDKDGAVLIPGRDLLFVKTEKPSNRILPVCKALNNSESLQPFPGE